MVGRLASGRRRLIRPIKFGDLGEQAHIFAGTGGKYPTWALYVRVDYFRFAQVIHEQFGPGTLTTHLLVRVKTFRIRHWSQQSSPCN